MFKKVQDDSVGEKILGYSVETNLSSDIDGEAIRITM
jgi:hypothetical protein